MMVSNKEATLKYGGTNARMVLICIYKEQKFSFRTLFGILEQNICSREPNKDEKTTTTE